MGKRLGMEWISYPAEPKIYDPAADGGLPSQQPVAPARLRLLPIYNRRDGEPGHYVILDRCVGIPANQLTSAAERLRSVLPVPVVIFAFEVEIPEVDDQDYADGDEELVQLDGTKVNLP